VFVHLAFESLWTTRESVCVCVLQLVLLSRNQCIASKPEKILKFYVCCVSRVRQTHDHAAARTVLAWLLPFSSFVKVLSARFESEGVTHPKDVDDTGRTSTYTFKRCSQAVI
jgi:hypothetical protein